MICAWKRILSLDSFKLSHGIYGGGIPLKYFGNEYLSAAFDVPTFFFLVLSTSKKLGPRRLFDLQN